MKKEKKKKKKKISKQLPECRQADRNEAGQTKGRTAVQSEQGVINLEEFVSVQFNFFL